MRKYIIREDKMNGEITFQDEYCIMPQYMEHLLITLYGKNSMDFYKRNCKVIII